QGLSGHPQASTRWIVAAQLALSLILLIGSGLFIRTFRRLMTLDAGFDPRNVLMVETNIHNARTAEPARVQLYGEMLAKLRSIPGVVSASQCWITPLSGHQWDNNFTIPGHRLPAGDDLDTLLNWVTPGYFETMRTRVLEGRTFEAGDSATSNSVVVVNQLFADRYFGGQSPIGEHLLGGSVGMLKQPMEIIGVVQDAKYGSLNEGPMPEAYFPLSQIQQNVSEDTTFLIRTAAPPATMIPAVRDAMASVNKLTSLQFTTLEQQAEDSVIQQRLLAMLSGFFAALAVILTAIGLYGVLAYVVTLRTHEIGIRMALGARQSSILRVVLRDLAIVLGAGIAAGLLGSAWITRLAQQLLFGVKPDDVWSISLAVALLVCVALIASYVPARRAMQVDPMVALRHE
ncbi:MAG TPA: ABC transporter permease, partial [Terriglobales bacterium]|nr:ABC transporter permease [Terriglobales bacterium]